MSTAQENLKIVRSFIKNLHAEDQEAIAELADHLRRLLKAAGVTGEMALALIGAEMAIEEEKAEQPSAATVPALACTKPACEGATLVRLRKGEALQTGNGMLIPKFEGWFCPRCAGSYGQLSAPPQVPAGGSIDWACMHCKTRWFGPLESECPVCTGPYSGKYPASDAVARPGAGGARCP